MKKAKKALRNSIAFKSLVGILLLMVVFFTVISWVGYRSFSDVMLSQYADGAFRIAEYATGAVDADKLEEYYENGPEDEAYKTVLENLDQICNSTGATFVYVILPDRSDYGHITFLFSAINEESSYTHYEFGYVRETTNDDYRGKYRALYETDSTQELVVRDKGYISTDPHITAMVPLKGSDGSTKGILCVQRQMDVLAQVRRDYVRRILIALIILILVVITGQWVYLNRMVLSPVKKITDEAARFAEDNVASEQKLRETIRNRDEIGMLAGSIDRMEEQIENYIENLTKITAEKERISTELNLASRIQSSMLPNIFPPYPERKEFDLYAVMDPAREVGGDFYDFFMIDDDHLGLIMADVSGKGIPASLFMMASKILLKNNAMVGRSPREILEASNSMICSNNPEEMFITVWISILEISTGTLTAANAGHEYPILKRPGMPYEIIYDKHGFVLGGMDNVRYQEYVLHLDPGSKLFIYTDGLAEATDINKELYGTDRILDILNNIHADSPKEILEQVKTDVEKFVGDAPQFDDLTMMCVSYYGKDI